MASDPYKYFRIECREILAALGSGLLELEQGRTPELVARLLRLAHTLKGAARVVKQTEIGDLAHQVEDMLVPLRDGSRVSDRGYIDQALALVDAMNGRLRALSPEPSTPNDDSAANAAPPQGQLVRADAAEIDALSDGILEVSAKVVALRRSTDTLSRAVALSSALADVSSGRGGTAERSQSNALLDELRLVLRGLDRDTSLLVEQIERELGQVREAADRLRLLPAEVIFPRLSRSLRDAAVSLGRDIGFETRGGDVRLDADVLSSLEHCLVQLVRNAVAHGVESESDRAVAGKARRGRVEVAIFRRGSKVVASCSDDGRGIDIDAVRRALVARGMSPADTQRLDLAGLLSVLLQGGISTSSKVTSVSGRGVGLDVVRETVERLGGEFNAESERHQGTRFEIVVPVSVSALDALVVAAGERRVALPLANVLQTLALPESAINPGPEGDTIVFEGALLPFARLGKLLGGQVETRGRGNGSSVVVLEADGTRAALGVTRVLGTEHIVARALPRGTPTLRLVAAATLDDEGSPRLVLDPAQLVDEARRPVAVVLTPTVRRAPILVIDDSLTTRMLEQSILESAGYEVELATSAEEGMQKAQEKTYALFLVDVEMPGMDGFTFVERSRAMPGLREVPAILVTSRGSPEDRRRGEAAGASGYVAKGEFDQNALLERIRRLVG
jgi:two-component system, chemotaxis family, sensor kinase CheA